MGQSPAVLGVKPAFEDVDAQIFLAFHCAALKTESSPTTSGVLKANRLH